MIPAGKLAGLARGAMSKAVPHIIKWGGRAFAAISITENDLKEHRGLRLKISMKFLKERPCMCPYGKDHDEAGLRQILEYGKGEVISCNVTVV